MRRGSAAPNRVSALRYLAAMSLTLRIDSERDKSGWQVDDARAVLSPVIYYVQPQLLLPVSRKRPASTVRSLFLLRVQ